MDIYDLILAILGSVSVIILIFITEFFKTSEKAKVTTARMFLNYKKIRYSFLAFSVTLFLYTMGIFIWYYNRDLGNSLWVLASLVLLSGLCIMLNALLER